MNAIEQYWYAISSKAGDSRGWTQLHPQEQQLIIQAWNLLCQVLENGKNQ